MKGPVKAIVLAVAVLVLAGGAFWGGTAFQSAKGPTATAGPLAAGNGAMGQGGPMGDLTEEQQQELEGMTDEERRAWLQENMDDVRGDGMGGPMRGGTLEGEVVEVAEGTLTIKIESGSQTFYTDEDTVLAYVEGAGELTTGATVMVIATPSADGVTSASLVVVK